MRSESPYFFLIPQVVLKLILSSPILSGKDLARASAVARVLRDIIKEVGFQRKIQLEKPSFQIAISYMGAIFVWQFSKPAILYGAGPLEGFSSCTLPKELVKIQHVCASPHRAYVYGKDSEGNGLLASARIIFNRRGQNSMTIEAFTLVNPGFSKIAHISVGREYTMVCGAEANGKPRVSLMSSTASSEQGMAQLPDTFATLIQTCACGNSESLLLGKDQNGELVLASGGESLRFFDRVDKPGIQVTPFRQLRIPPQFAHLDQILARGGFKVLLGRNHVGSPLLAIAGLVPQGFKWPDPMRHRKDFVFIDLPREFVRIDQLVVNLEDEYCHSFRSDYLSRLFIHGVDKQGRPRLAQWAKKDSSIESPIFEFVKLPESFALLIQVVPGSIKMPDVCIPKLFSLYLIASGRDFNGYSQLAASGDNDKAGFRWEKTKELTLFRVPKFLETDMEFLASSKDKILEIAASNYIDGIKIFGKHINQEFPLQAGINFLIIPGVRMTCMHQRNFEQTVASLLGESIEVFRPKDLKKLVEDQIITQEQLEDYLQKSVSLEAVINSHFSKSLSLSNREDFESRNIPQ